MELNFKFSYGTKFRQIVNKLFEVYINLSIIIFLLLIYMFAVLAQVDNINSQNSAFKAFSIFVLCIFIAISVYLTVILFLPKKVVLNKYFIKVRRYNTPKINICRGFNDTIYIKDICECKPYEIVKYDNGHIYRPVATEFSVWLFNWYDLVEIKTKDERKYLIPVKDSKGFINEVHKRIDD